MKTIDKDIDNKYEIVWGIFKENKLSDSTQELIDPKIVDTRYSDMPNQFNIGLNENMFNHLIALLNTPDEKFKNIDNSSDILNEGSIQQISFDLQKFSQTFIDLYDDSNDLIPGETKETEHYIRYLFNKFDRNVVLSWLNKFFLDNFHRYDLISELIFDISHFDYGSIYPQGATMALAALNSVDDQVNECALRAFSNWNRKETLKFLESIRIDHPLLEELFEKIKIEISEKGR